MFDNYNATLFNQYRRGNKVFYKRTYLYGIDWQCEAGVKSLKTSKTSIDSKNDIVLFIPYDSTDKKYVQPKAYQQLENTDGFYTLQPHDKIIKGIVDIEINDSQDYRNLELKHDDVATVYVITDCDIMNHFEVECD